jgi:hypothetical protein
MLQGKGLDVPLELSLKDLHVQVVLVDLLLTGALTCVLHAVILNLVPGDGGNPSVTTVVVPSLERQGLAVGRGCQGRTACCATHA